MHHVPALFLHPSRRLRALAQSAHAEILRAEPLRIQMFFHLREVASAEQVECILGSWCMATRDVERQVAQVAQRSWDAYISLHADSDAAACTAEKDKKLVLDSAQMATLLAFVQRGLLDPLALHAYLNPVQVPVDIAVPKTIRGRPVPTPVMAVQTRRTDNELPARVKGESEEENEADRKARLRIGALGALQWILGA
jgi:E3 ubiquitin-protein ligase listerin